MRTLKDLKLSKKATAIVEEWLGEWLELFQRQADHRPYWVYRVNFDKSDFFFFTGCKDILSKDPEARAVENNKTIRVRKRNVMFQLLIKTMMDKRIPICKLECNHCGYKNCYIDSLPDLGGHWVYCPKCHKTDIHVFPMSYDTCINNIKKQISVIKYKEVNNERSNLRTC